MFFTAGELQAVAIVLILIVYEFARQQVLAIKNSIMRHESETRLDVAVEETTEHQKENHDANRERRQTLFEGKGIVHEESEARTRKVSGKTYFLTLSYGKQKRNLTSRYRFEPKSWSGALNQPSSIVSNHESFRRTN